jgi:hypothetical protein
MSRPTRGMVAGQPIKTGAQTKEFDEGYERAFGKDRKPVRGRFIYDAVAGQVVEVGADWEERGRETGHKSEEEIYGSLTATDGSDISTRRRHREYMKANGLSLADDFKGHWEDAAKKREAVLSGEADRKERRELIGRVLHEAKTGRLNRPKLGVLDDE